MLFSNEIKYIIQTNNRFQWLEALSFSAKAKKSADWFQYDGNIGR